MIKKQGTRHKKAPRYKLQETKKSQISIIKDQGDRLRLARNEVALTAWDGNGEWRADFDN